MRISKGLKGYKMSKIGLNKVQILHIIKSQGYFSVHKYKYSQSNLRSKLRGMRKEGLIRIQKQQHKDDNIYYKEVEENE